MSTKNLARTVIEGGRYRSGSQFCRYKNRALRARTRVALGEVACGRDADDLTIRPARKVGRWFHDKLGPSERWLASQVGRPWDLVRGELVRKFDPRTTAGRHIVFDHMLPSIHGEDRFGCQEHGYGCHHDFRIDRHGLLRRVRARPRSWPQPPEPLPRPEHELLAWLSGRRIGACGEKLFWFIPTARGGYRQHHRLGDADAALWRSLPDWFRACHDPLAPRPRHPERQN